jgi:hypothetical protein
MRSLNSSQQAQGVALQLYGRRQPMQQQETGAYLTAAARERMQPLDRRLCALQQAGVLTVREQPWRQLLATLQGGGHVCQLS